MLFRSPPLPPLPGPGQPPSSQPVSVFGHDDEDSDHHDYDDDAVPLRDLETGGGGKRATVAIMTTTTTSSTATSTTTMMTMTKTTAAAAAAATATASAPADRVHASGPRASRANLRRMLLLNGYPVLWIALWIPGMATRLTEAVAGRSPVWLQVAQASTQYIGLANALTYSWNEKMTQRLRTLVRWRPLRDETREGGGRGGRKR